MTRAMTGGRHATSTFATQSDVTGEKLTSGLVGVTIITRDPDLAPGLWDQGRPVTAQSGRTRAGRVTILTIPVSRRDEARLRLDVHNITPDVLWTSGELQAPHPSAQPPANRSSARRDVRRSRIRPPRPDGTARDYVLEHA